MLGTAMFSTYLLTGSPALKIFRHSLWFLILD
nr:MAG TPA: hypothetical protein [Caudoviricetes sp.]